MFKVFFTQRVILDNRAAHRKGGYMYLDPQRKNRTTPKIKASSFSKQHGLVLKHCMATAYKLELIREDSMNKQIHTQR